MSVPPVSSSVASADAPQPVRRKWSMALINFWLDVALLVSFTFVGWITATLQAVFPEPTSSAGWSLWGMNFNQWYDIQFYAICFFAFLVLVHVMLHWNWVCNVIAAQVLRVKTRPDDGLQTIYGVGLMIVLLNLIVGGVIAAILTVRHPAF
ncbi:MAG: DUF4405 domain-containing protein [Planctomycetaceae bacterium]|jgi:hypothetical protein